MRKLNVLQRLSMRTGLIASAVVFALLVASATQLSGQDGASSQAQGSATATATATPTRAVPSRTPSPTPTPSPTVATPVEAPFDAYVRPQPVTPRGVEFAPDAPLNIAAYTPPAGFVYSGARMANVSAADFPSWISYDVNNDNEQVGETEETWNSSLYAYYNSKFGQTYQYNPIEVHAHWWGDPATSPSHNAIVNYIDNKDALTVNFVVSANRVTNMMPLSWMATTTGYRNPWAWKMEIDPRLSDDIYKTVGALMYVVERKNPWLASEPIRLHKEFYPTGCSEIDVAYLRSWVNKFATGEYDITTGQPGSVPPPAPAPAPVPSPSPSVSVAPAPSPTPSPSVSVAPDPLPTETAAAG